MELELLQTAFALRNDLEAECADARSCTLAVDTLLKYADNTTHFPDEAKYRNVNPENKLFVERVGKYPSGRKLMELMGFSPDIQAGRLILEGAVRETVVRIIRGSCETARVAPAPVVAADAASAGSDVFASVASGSGRSSPLALDASTSSASAMLTDGESTPARTATPAESPPPASPRVAVEAVAELPAPVEPAEASEASVRVERVLPAAAAAAESPEPAVQVEVEVEVTRVQERVWACVRCTFHNAELVSACDICGTARHPDRVSAACSPMPAQEEEVIRVRSVSVAAHPDRSDAAIGSPLLTADASCSPFPEPAPPAPVATASVGCSANVRAVQTPPDSEELHRLRRLVAQLGSRSASGASAASGSGSVLQEVTNDGTLGQAARGASKHQRPARVASGSAASAASSGDGQTPLRRELAGALECGVCLSLMVHPVTVPCGHSFCRHCLVEAVAKVSKKCPSCRADCDADLLKYPENKRLVEAARLVNPAEYDARAKEANEQLRRLERSAKAVRLPVLIGDDCPCPGSTFKLQVAEDTDVQLLRYIARSNGGAFVLLQSSAGSVRNGQVGLQCTIRRSQDLPNGHAMASVHVGKRCLVSHHETAEHTVAEVLPYADTNETAWEVLAAVHDLRRLLRDFFKTQAADVQRQVERLAGPEPALASLPQARARVHECSTRYTFWVAAVLAHLRVLAKRMKPALVQQQDCLARTSTLANVVRTVLRTGAGSSAAGSAAAAAAQHQQRAAPAPAPAPAPRAAPAQPAQPMPSAGRPQPGRYEAQVNGRPLPSARPPYGASSYRSQTAGADLLRQHYGVRAL
eukprot:Rhum_TRINITY_DN9990_c0_g1::Rhum_TRINITY_DN9990_c0_g1_i1::g.36277::m.36277